MRSKFEITFLDKTGNLVGDPNRQDVSNAIPVLDIIICPPGATQDNGVHCKALVDTGADYTVVSYDLVNRLNAKYLRTVMNSGVNGTVETTLHDMTFYLTATDGHQLKVESDIVLNQHPNTAYPVIIGRSTFRHGTLLLDYRAGLFEFIV